MTKQTLKAEKRDLLGRKVKVLRRDGVIPANIFGKNIKSTSIKIEKKEFDNLFSEVGETGLFYVQLGKEERPVLVHNIQKDPVTDQILHVDFVQVNLKEKTTANVPVFLVGESPAEKQGLGTVVLMINEVEVEALPSDIPDKFEVDASGLKEVDQSVVVKDLKLDSSKVKILDEENAIVVKVEPPQKEEEIAPVAVETEEEGGTTEEEVEKTEDAKETPKEVKEQE